MYVYTKKRQVIKEQFINGINDNDMITEIIWNLSAIKKTNQITSEQVLAWTRCEEAQWVKKALIKATKRIKILIL